MLRIPVKVCPSLVSRSCCVSRGSGQQMRQPQSPAASWRCSSTLLDKKCVPCEKDEGSLNFMGLCESLDRSEAESLAAGEVMSSRHSKPA